MANIKDLFMRMDVSDDRAAENAVEVYADSVAQALELAASELGIDVTLLDYQIIEKGTRGFHGDRPRRRTTSWSRRWSTRRSTAIWPPWSGSCTREHAGRRR